MAQAKEEKRGLLAFWEGFKEGWSSSSATAQETPPPAPAEEVITAADEWDVNELQNAAVATEAIETADERDMPEPAMTAVAAPQEKRGLAAFFEGFKEGWNNPPPASEVEMANEEEAWQNPWTRKKWHEKGTGWEDELPVLSDYDDRIWTDPLNPMVVHYLSSKNVYDNNI